MQEGLDEEGGNCDELEIVKIRDREWNAVK